MPDLESKIVLRFRGHAVIFTGAVSRPRSFSAVENFNGARISPAGVKGRASERAPSSLRNPHLRHLRDVDCIDSDAVGYAAAMPLSIGGLSASVVWTLSAWLPFRWMVIFRRMLFIPLSRDGFAVRTRRARLRVKECPGTFHLRTVADDALQPSDKGFSHLFETSLHTSRRTILNTRSGSGADV